MDAPSPNSATTTIPFALSLGAATLDGEALLPSAKGPFPTFVLAHGFGANREETRRFALPLLQQGYAAFIFDFLGSGNPASKSRGRSTLMMNPTTLLDDFHRVIAYARNQSYVDPSRLSLLGCSQGGLLSVIVAAEKGFPVASLILLYPGLSIPEEVRKGSFLGHSFPPGQPPETLKAFKIRISRSYLLAVERYQVEDLLPRLSCPTLIIHSVFDQLVPYPRIKDLSSLIPQSEMQTIVWGLHGLNSRHNTAKANARIQDFLSRRNPT